VCTLILAADVLGAGTLLLAANRDEDPARPSDPPRTLIGLPPVVGGADRRAGGTWLAVRERRAAIALLNRRDAAAGSPPAGRRSRGLLVLDVASVTGGLDEPAPGPRHLAVLAAERLRLEVARSSYAPFTLLFAAPGGSWIGVNAPGAPLSIDPISPGWHVVTHADLDDPEEPRTVWLRRSLEAWRPAGPDDALAGLSRRLATHRTDADDAIDVCIHRGPAVTVSTSAVFLSNDGARYFHAEGRPCEHPLEDRSHLLAGATPAGEIA
jgi:hypothetical protein